MWQANQHAKGRNHWQTCAQLQKQLRFDFADRHPRLDFCDLPSVNCVTITVRLHDAIRLVCCLHCIDGQGTGIKEISSTYGTSHASLATERIGLHFARKLPMHLLRGPSGRPDYNNKPYDNVRKPSCFPSSSSNGDHTWRTPPFQLPLFQEALLILFCSRIFERTI